jgi:hypothetical protein
VFSVIPLAFVTLKKDHEEACKKSTTDFKFETSVAYGGLLSVYEVN